MESYIVPAHWILTLFLMALYLFLTLRFFRNKDNEITSLDRILVQCARYALLIVYVTGLLMNVTLGMMVHKLHHTISLLPAIIMVGIRYLPHLTKRQNSVKTFAWIFAIMLILMLIIGITSNMSALPRF